MELHSIKYCFSIISFQVPMKIDKNTTNAYTYYEKYDKNNITYIVQE